MRGTKSGRRALVVLTALVWLLAPGDGHAGKKKKSLFVSTEERERCEDFSTLRNPYFGELHTHTTFSFDAVTNGTRNDPRDAYRFALGESVGLPPYDLSGAPARTLALRRALDFAAVTDHAEYFGEVDICTTPGLPGYGAPECVALRADIGQPSIGLSVVLFFGIKLALPAPDRFTYCGTDGSVCLGRASLIWQETQAAAEEFYDRTESCSFTTFVAYEWSGAPAQANIHRNVVFRNDEVPALPISYFEEPIPQDLWAALRSQCKHAPGRCDVLAIPHNSNVSLGRMFRPFNADNSPITAADARLRAEMEPLVEVTQHKGTSECRPGVSTTDEQCGFELLRRRRIIGPPETVFDPQDYVRNVLKEGVQQEALIGANPFKLGMIGSTDTHNGTPGATAEADYGRAGHLGNWDATADLQLTLGGLGGIEANPGGLAVVWAEENSRDALFTAMERREVYATSGTRPIVRFFGGWEIKHDACKKKKFVKQAYKRGVPMGGDLPARSKRARQEGGPPRFLISALKDPGSAGAPGTRLQRAEIIKGWVDASGATHEMVYAVAGEADNGAGVDLATCQPTGPGLDSLCAVWEDPDFDASERAFYYARVLENPSCRWSTWLCNDDGADCTDLGFEPPPPLTIQERAWTSPIWYQPEGG